MSRVKLALDLTTTAGRAAMRAYLDALDSAERVDFAAGFQRGYAVGRDDGRGEVTGGEQSAGEGTQAPPPAVVAEEIPAFMRIVETSFPPRQAQAEEGVATQEREEERPSEAVAPGVASPRCSGSEGVDARPQQSLQANPDLPPGGADIEEEDLGPVPIEEPEPPAAEPPAPVDVVDVAPAAVETAEGGASGEDLDPERPWTDALRLQVWDMREAGVAASEIAERLNLRKQRVWSFFSNVKHGSVKLPPRAGATALAVVAPSAGALAVADRRPAAQDPDMQAARLDEMEAAERAKFVMKATHPEFFA